MLFFLCILIIIETAVAHISAILGLILGGKLSCFKIIHICSGLGREIIAADSLLSSIHSVYQTHVIVLCV